MTDFPETAQAPGMTSHARDILKRGATSLAPYARYAPKNPALLIGAVVVGLAGVLAWRNRERIRATAGPMLQNALDQGAQLRQRLPFLSGRERATRYDPTVH